MMKIAVIRARACSILGAPMFLLAAIAFGSRAASEAVLDVVIPVPRAEEAARRKNLLPNGDFERSEHALIEEWDGYGAGYAVVEREGRDRSRCLMCESTTLDERRGAVTRLELDQERAIPLYVEGWSMAENVSGAEDADYSIYIDCVYADGTPLWGTNAPFSTGTHDWQKVSFFVTPAKPIKTISLNLLFRFHSGKVWFDDVKLTQLTLPGGPSFDGVATLKLEEPHPPQPGETIISSGDGLAIALGRVNCTAAIVRVNGKPLRFSGAPTGFFARDAAAQSSFHSFRGEIKADRSGRAVISAESPSLSLNLAASVEARENRIEVSGTLGDLTGHDRSVSLYFALPVGGGNLVWWDDATSWRETSRGGDFRNVEPVGAGANGTMSLYPLSAICDAEKRIGLCLAIPMDSPRLYRIACDADRGIIYIAYDLGLCRDVEGFPGSASFKFIVCSFDSTWGFRAALKKYYDIYPDFFTKRVHDEGLWMAFLSISTVENFQDFGFVFKEGANETKFDDQHGILTFRYTEPQSYWQKMPEEVERTYEGCVNSLDRDARAGNPNALATLSSAIHDARGRYRFTVENTPWCDGCAFAINPSPSLKGTVTKARLNYDIGDADRRYGDTSEGVLDGEYLDSLEGWSDLCNFRREHFASARIPLTFDTSTKKPCILNVFSIYEFARYISDDVHRRGKLMMANAVPRRFGFLCHLFDTCGIEINWKRGGQFQPEGEAIMNYRRAMMFQKPYLFLMNTDFNAWSYSETEMYMRRCMFFAFYPSFFSADASSTNHYFSQTGLYNRDRPLFKKYVPIIRSLGKAGWQPIPHAKSSDPEVRIERYGEGSPCYLTLLNASGKAKTVVVEVDLAALGLAGGELAADVLSSDRRLHMTRKGNVAALTLELSPNDSEVVRLGERAEISRVTFLKQKV